MSNIWTVNAVFFEEMKQYGGRNAYITSPVLEEAVGVVRHVLGFNPDSVIY